MMRISLHAGQGFTDNEVMLVVDSQPHIMALTAQPLSEGQILLELSTWTASVA